MTSPIENLQQRLSAGDTIILDGAVGTELERRGADMDNDAWCGLATLAYPELLRKIHEDYVRAGADIITTNTFSSNRNMLGPAGHGERVEEANRRAVEIALQAREAADRPVAVAGSMSHQVPLIRGTMERDSSRALKPEQARQNFFEMAEILADAGVDILLMEMMSAPDLAGPAIEAALSTGLPVWVGLSCRAGDDGTARSFSLPERSFTDVAAEILACGGEVAGIMHSNVNITETALEALKQIWQGPLMAYPDSGYFKMPHWQFEDIIPAPDFARQVGGWVRERGVQVVGGCCGLGLEHISALTEELTA